jgi:HD-GYP domain-containing protein (c-di-GMP phosphodiesterase class II)
MAVADVFDALVSERVYKKAFSFEKAMEIIREESGTHFDPRIVKAFVAVEDEVRETAEKLQKIE